MLTVFRVNQCRGSGEGSGIFITSKVARPAGSEVASHSDDCIQRYSLATASMAIENRVMNIVQLAYYVRDAQLAAREWARHHQAGPFFFAKHIALENVLYNGAPGSLDHSSAYGWCGHHMIELVQQNCSAPSVFMGRPWGLHHCAYFAPDLETELGRLGREGYTTAMRAATQSGVNFAFVQNVQKVQNVQNLQNAQNPPSAAAPHGHYLEIYQDTPQLRRFYEMVSSAATGWDGRDPLRSMD